MQRRALAVGVVGLLLGSLLPVVPAEAGRNEFERVARPAVHVTQHEAKEHAMQRPPPEGPYEPLAAPFWDRAAGPSSLDAALFRPLVTASQSEVPKVHQGPGWIGYASDTQEPSSSSVAQGPYEVVQVSDLGLRIHTSNLPAESDDLLWDISLASFFLAGADEGIQADPRIVYDWNAQRWFVTALSAACGPGYSIGITYLAVSASENLLDDGWTVYTFSSEGLFFDYPTLGVTSDKVVIGTNVFSFSGCSVGPGFFGADLLVVSKFDVRVGQAADFAYDPPDPNLFTNVPATNRSLDATARVVSADSADGDVQYFTVTGDPDAGTTTFGSITNLTASLALPAFATPPAPRQPGTPSTIANAVDGRPTDALWADGRLSFPSTTNCTPAGDTAERACARVTTLTTTTLAVWQDFTIEFVGKDTFTPGIALSYNFDTGRWTPILLTYARSSSTEFVSVYAAHHGSQAGSDPAPNELSTSVLLVAGEGTYQGSRWGSYHQLGLNGDVFQAMHFPTADGGWATWVSRVSMWGTNPPDGAVEVDRDRASAIYRQAMIRTVPAVQLHEIRAGVSQVLISNSPSTSGGVLDAAAQYPPVAALPWLLDDPDFGGTNAVGTKTVYVQFGYGDGTWSPVRMDSIELVAGGVQRLAGADRYATAAEVSAATFNPGLPTVFLAAGLSFPDALAGGPVAGRNGIPILLVQLNSAPAATMNELARLNPAQIVILGGPGVVSNAVAGQVAPLVDGHVYRIAGVNRFATAAAISAAYYGSSQPRVYVANGLNFPDALAGAAAAAHLEAPLLLVSPTSLPAETAAELSRMNPGEIIVLGGTGSVSNGVKNALAANCGCPVIRIGGANRYATAALVAHEAWGTTDPGFDDVEVTFVATGVSFPDALSGAGAAGLHGGPLLLASRPRRRPSSLSSVQIGS
jgi:putative cell wall-binding protein